jgi:hypothetical protein
VLLLKEVAFGSRSGTGIGGFGAAADQLVAHNFAGTWKAKPAEGVAVAAAASAGTGSTGFGGGNAVWVAPAPLPVDKRAPDCRVKWMNIDVCVCTLLVFTGAGAVVVCWWQ